LAFVTSGTVALILVPLTALGAVVVPALQGLVSKSVGDDEQGEVQGLLSSAMSVAMILSPLLMTNTFYLFTREGAPVYLPGAPFLVSMVLMGVCAVIFLQRQRATEA
ncbi:MAG: tetracycline resistance MFS efflux pump, partial [Pseudomonadota bacterium]